MSKTAYIEIEPLMRNYTSSAVSRMSYLHPDANFEETSTGIIITFCDQYQLKNLKKEFKYQLYREKIFHDTLEIRKNYYKMLSVC